MVGLFYGQICLNNVIFQFLKPTEFTWTSEQATLYNWFFFFFFFFFFWLALFRPLVVANLVSSLFYGMGGRGIVGHF